MVVIDFRAMASMRTGTYLVFLVAISCDQHGTKGSAKGERDGRDATGPTKPIATNQGGPFANTLSLREAILSPFGTVGWKNLGPELGYYGYSQIEILPATGLFPSTVKYAISGKTEDKVDHVLLAAFIAAPGDLGAGKARLHLITAQWFKSIGKTAPPGLVAAIKNGKSLKMESGGISLNYLVERGDGNPIKQPDGSLYRCTTMDLTIRPI